MGVALVMALVVVTFRIAGAGTPTAPATNRSPCPDGKWSQAILATDSPRRVGTDYGCALSIRKTDRANWGVYRITQTARELLVLPNGTISGSGPVVDGRANYRLTLRLR